MIPVAVDMDTVTAAAAVISLVLGVAALGRTPRRSTEWCFAAGMLGFAIESMAAYGLLTRTEHLDERLLWLRALAAVGLLLLVPWAAFVGTLAKGERDGNSTMLRMAVGGTAAVVVAGSLGTLLLPAFQLSDVPGPFYAARLDTMGRYTVTIQLLGTLAILGGLEWCLRASRGSVRWRIKYLILGLGGIFLARFFFLSQVLLFQVLMASYLTAGAATLIIGCAAAAVALARNRPPQTSLTLSRQLVFRSVVVSVLGFYLLAVGLLGWALTRLGIPEEVFWGSLIVFASATAVAALLLSENLRWRVKQFIALNFYRSKYDYRQQWELFTRRLGPLVAVEDLGPQLLSAVIEAVGTTRAALYLADERDGAYHPASSLETERPLPVLPADAALIDALRSGPGPLPLDDGHHILVPDGLEEPWAVAVPLRWRGALLGLILIGQERMGTPYTPEDLEFLGTVGDQAAGAIATASLTEAVARSREFEAFHRLTSFVAHDLKNSVSALSMLGENASRHFDDREFQRDAIKTLARTVDRMKALMAKLASAHEAGDLRLEPTDIAAVAREATEPLSGHQRVRLVQELAPLAPVLADREAVLRVIQNLVTNAVEAIDGQGTITVTTYGEPGWAVVSVADTGCGIPEDFLRRSLFAPFRTTKKGGWGVGLYQARSVIEGHGGRIEVASRQGEGTTFWVKLPKGSPAPGTSEVSQ